MQSPASGCPPLQTPSRLTFETFTLYTLKLLKLQTRPRKTPPCQHWLQSTRTTHGPMRTHRAHHVTCAQHISIWKYVSLTHHSCEEKMKHNETIWNYMSQYEAWADLEKKQLLTFSGAFFSARSCGRCRKAKRYFRSTTNMWCSDNLGQLDLGQSSTDHLRVRCSMDGQPHADHRYKIFQVSKCSSC